MATDEYAEGLTVIVHGHDDHMVCRRFFNNYYVQVLECFLVYEEDYTLTGSHFRWADDIFRKCTM